MWLSVLLAPHYAWLTNMDDKQIRLFAGVRARSLELDIHKVPEFTESAVKHWWAGHSHEMALRKAAEEIANV